MSVFDLNSLPKSKYSNLFIVAALSNKSFSSKTSLSVKDLYLVTFSDKVGILTICLSKTY